MSNTFGPSKIVTVSGGIQIDSMKRVRSVSASGGVAPICTHVSITNFSGSPIPTLIGTPYLGTTSFVGTPPVTFSLDSGTLPAGLSLNPSTGVISGTPSGPAGTSEFTLKAVNDCPSETTFPVSIVVSSAPPIPHNIRWGLFVCANFPADPPTLVASDLTGSNSNYTSVGTSDASSCIRSYHYPENSGARQILWIADALIPLTKNYKLSGFPFSWFPAANTPNQSLTVAGIPGKLFISSQWNLGAFDIDVTA